LEHYIPALAILTGEDDDSNANIEASKILDLLSKLKVERRSSTPLKLELTFLYLDRVILYYSADAETIGSSIVEGKFSIFQEYTNRTFSLEVFYTPAHQFKCSRKVSKRGTKAD
jgi:hypothetical protein